MRVLVACECSGRVRDAFRAMGHEAVSCDLVESENGGSHVVGDVRTILSDGWDLMIAHPPCTFFTTTGARWFYHPQDRSLPKEQRRPHPSFPDRIRHRDEMMSLFLELMNAPIAKIAVENPVGYLSTAFRKPDQIIQPFQFGHDATKATCLWLKGLPKLTPTKTVEVSYLTTSTGKRFSRWYWETSRAKGLERQQERSRTFLGIADAMADQWGHVE